MKPVMHHRTPFALAAPFGWLITAMVKVTVLWPVYLVRYLWRRETQRTTQATYAVVTHNPQAWQWAAFWNDTTGSWEYRLAPYADPATVP